MLAASPRPGCTRSAPAPPSRYRVVLGVGQVHQAKEHQVGVFITHQRGLPLAVLRNRLAATTEQLGGTKNFLVAHQVARVMCYPCHVSTPVGQGLGLRRRAFWGELAAPLLCQEYNITVKVSTRKK